MKSSISSQISTRAAILAIALLASVSSPLLAAAPSSDTASPAPVAPAAEPADSTVVGKAVVDGKTLEVTYGEVKGKLKLLPPQLQSAPFKDIFPLLLKSVVTEKIISYYAEQSGIKNDPDYQKMVGECQKGVLQKLFLDKEIDKRATDDELKKAYEDVKKAAPKEDEYDISMITLTDKTKAENVLKELKKSGVSKFAEVANKESMNKIPDGNLGYVRLGELPEAFRDKVKVAAKATIVQNIVEISMPDPSDAGKKVTTYNILMVKDKRAATFPPFDAVKGELKSAVGPKFAKEAIKEFEGKAKIELFGMDGKPLESPKADAPKADAPKADAPKADAPKVDAPKAAPAA